MQLLKGRPGFSSCEGDRKLSKGCQLLDPWKVPELPRQKLPQYRRVPDALGEAVAPSLLCLPQGAHDELQRGASVLGLPGDLVDLDAFSRRPHGRLEPAKPDHRVRRGRPRRLQVLKLSSCP